MTDNKPLGLKHHDLGPSRIRKDELAVQSLVDLMDKEWINPFGSDPMELTSLSTGTVVPPDVASNLLKAIEIGEKAYKEFHVDRIESREKCFHDTLSKQKLKTVSDVNKSSVTKGKNKETVLKADHKLFGHMVLIATSRKLDMRAVLEHPLGLLPWSLGNSDRTLKKTSKASLTRQLERNVSVSDEIPQPSTCFIDGMSLVQKAHGEGKTFGELSESILVCALRISSNSDRIDVVFDVYRHSSNKYAERVHRGSESGLRFTNIVRGHKVKQWRRMLSSSESKVNFIRFLANDWQMAEMRATLQGKVLYVT